MPLIETLKRNEIGRVVFFDEFAIHKDYRREGFDPVRYLARSGFEIGIEGEVRQILFWTKTTSKIYPITLAFGFEPVGKVGELTFMLNRDVVPTLKMLQNLERDALGSHLIKVLGKLR